MVLSGFGPAVEDGFGICYTTTADRITITITSKSVHEVSMTQFAADLKNALKAMAALFK